jgi:transglutaminase-like putative cysteine protease
LIYSISHTTVYTYSKRVFLEPHIIRLYPRSDPAQKVLGHEIKISPDPAGMSMGVDIWGNSFAQLWFDDLHQQMKIVSQCRVETLRHNPFDYFLPHKSQNIPVHLDQGEKNDLMSCLTRQYPLTGPAEDPLRELAISLIKKSNGLSTNFLTELNVWIFKNVQLRERNEPGIISPDALMNQKVGSCRDLAVLFIEICREAGIPARFVSGYQEGDSDIPEADLHAWVEVYLPGIGWRGYDPSHGLVVADRHVILAAAPDFGHTMPVSGTYRGTGASSKIDHQVRMDSLSM